ncbi:MAG: 2Fe-2S iron-sulfur cluster-binding protein [Kiritimatiellae bacterium]|nr:2Fe-2S iron-sulfur cluster-binding protein [Kiritimatiellia bacterium]
MTVDGQAVELKEGMTVYDAVRQAGIGLPVLCHRDGLTPTGGCGICTVEEVTSGRLLPACATRAEASMVIATGSEAAVEFRRTALELLLSNHPADCDAPCQLACPSGLPAQELMERILAGDWEGARVLARRYPFACASAAPCEKACRRKPLGGAVAVCALHRWLAEGEGTGPQEVRQEAGKNKGNLPRFRSRMRGLTEEALLALCSEKGERLLASDATGVTPEAAVYEAARCMRCGCRKPDDCRLRELCAAADAKQSSFAGETRPILRQRSRNGFRFDSSRCVLCGLCVRTAQKAGASLAPAFHGRGFEAQIGPPHGRTWDDIPEAVLAMVAAVCPTGAMTAEAAPSNAGFARNPMSNSQQGNVQPKK